MSLINDALKRARTVQAQTPLPPPEHLPLRPADPQVAVLHGIGLAIPVALAVVALLILFLAWRLYQDRGAGAQPQLVVSAKSDATPAPAVQPIVTAPAAPAPEPTNVPAPANTTSSAPPTSGPAATNESTQAAGNPTPTATNAAVPPEPPAPKPPPLKLQGVVYSPTRPSAVISGKTVFIGDRIREYRVVAIRADSATLVNGGQTNVLTLSD